MLFHNPLVLHLAFGFGTSLASNLEGLPISVLVKDPECCSEHSVLQGTSRTSFGSEADASWHWSCWSVAPMKSLKPRHISQSLQGSIPIRAVVRLHVRLTASLTSAAFL